MGLDVGDRRVGVALSDPTAVLASPLPALVVRSEEERLNRVTALAAEHEVESIVVGMPYSLDGAVGPQAEATAAFGRALARRLGVPVDSWDERLSTVQAQRQQRGSDAGRRAGGRRRRRPEREPADTDSLAAAIVLQAYLDARRADSEHGH